MNILGLEDSKGDKIVDLQSREIYYSTEHQSEDFSVFTYSKTCYFKEHFNRKMLLLHAHGLIFGPKYSYPGEKSEGTTHIKLAHLLGAYMILFVGFTLAFLSFILELLLKNFKIM